MFLIVSCTSCLLSNLCIELLGPCGCQLLSKPFPFSRAGNGRWTTIGPMFCRNLFHRRYRRCFSREYFFCQQQWPVGKDAFSFDGRDGCESRFSRIGFVGRVYQYLATWSPKWTNQTGWIHQFPTEDPARPSSRGYGKHRIVFSPFPADGSSHWFIVPPSLTRIKQT